MPKDKTESHNRIKAVARSEFLEKGFEKASMREIARKVGMTQAGLYRHYESKEAMFNDLVEPFVRLLTEKAYQHEADAYSKFDRTSRADSMVQDNMVKMVKDLMVDYHDELRLLICCSHGTKYESFIHDMVRMETTGTLKAFDYLRQHGIPVHEISEAEIHVLLSAYMTAVLEPIAHDWPMEQAMRCLDLVEEFFIAAWKQIMGFWKGEEDEERKK